MKSEQKLKVCIKCVLFRIKQNFVESLKNIHKRLLILFLSYQSSNLLLILLGSMRLGIILIPDYESQNQDSLPKSKHQYIVIVLVLGFGQWISKSRFTAQKQAPIYTIGACFWAVNLKIKIGIRKE